MKIKMLRNFDEFLRQLLLVVVDDGHHLAFAGDLREGGAMMFMVLCCYQVNSAVCTSLATYCNKRTGHSSFTYFSFESI